MGNDVKYLTISDEQRYAIDKCKEKIGEWGGVLLNGELGSGKSLIALTTAYELGFTKILYITEPRLIPEMDYHSDIEIKTLKYSEFKILRNSSVATKEKAKELCAGISNDYFVILDECSGIKNITSQRTRVWCAMRNLLKDNKVMLMSGTLKTLHNEDLVPYIYTVKQCYASYDNFTEYMQFLKSQCDYFSPKKPMPHISRFATKTTDAHTDELKALYNEISVKVHKVRDGEINIFEAIILCDDSNATSSKKASNFHPLAINNPNSMRRVYDGYNMLVDGSIHTLAKQPKLDAIHKLIKAHSDISHFIILAAFKHSVVHIYNNLSTEYNNVVMYDVDDSGSVCSDKIKQFKSAERGILVGTVAALGTGFNLDESDAIIYYSLSYNGKDFVQSQGRIDRKISTRDKHYYYLCLDNRNEKQILKREIEKNWKNMEDFGFIINSKKSVIKL